MLQYLRLQAAQKHLDLSKHLIKGFEHWTSGPQGSHGHQPTGGLLVVLPSALEHLPCALEHLSRACEHLPFALEHLPHALEHLPRALEHLQAAVAPQADAFHWHWLSPLHRP